MSAGATSPAPAVPADVNDGKSDERLTFGHFTVLPSARKLLRDGMEVAIGGRAFDLLVTLLRSRGRVVPKNEIMRHVWPTTTVDECNLRFQMKMLRRALGDARALIVTIPGRGYLLATEPEDELGHGDAGDGPVKASVIPPPHTGLLPPAQVLDQAVADVLRTLLKAVTRHPDVSALLDGLIADATSSGRSDGQKNA